MRSSLKKAYPFFLLLVVLAFLRSEQPRAQGATVVSKQGTDFLVNGTVPHRGTAAEGLLLNSRMVQAAFDDENSSTVGNWKYPDTGRWDPDRNTDEFIAALPGYKAKGMLAFTVNLQGGSPGIYTGNNQPNITSAFASDGTLKLSWVKRLDRIIRAADANGLIVIVGYFYFGQDHRVANEAAVIRAVDTATDWILASGYRNVLIEVNNECNVSYNHAILQPERVVELINRVQQRSGGQLFVSTSFGGGVDPSDAVIAASDYVLVHGNGQDAAGIRDRINRIRSRPGYQSKPKPILFNEDSTRLLNFDAAVASGASWGYYDQGDNNYRDGYQSPPVNWTINTSAKQAFFDRVANATDSSGSPPPTSQAVTSFTLINADTDQPIAGYNPLPNGTTLNLATLPTRNLNLVANTSPSIVGSVRFAVDGNSNFRTESDAPYTLAGDANGDYAAWTLALGSHVVTATPFSSSGGGGTAGTSLSRQFTIIDDAAACQYTLSATSSSTFAPGGGNGNVGVTTGPACGWTANSNANWITITAGSSVTGPGTVSYSVAAHTGGSLRTGTVTIANQLFTVTQAASTSSTQVIVSFTLINADTDQPIAGYESIPDGATLNLVTLPTRNLNLVANPSPSTVGSVRFAVNSNSNYRTENEAPYSLAGDKNGDYPAWSLSPGLHIVTATPYSSANGGGTTGTSLSRQFTIVDDGLQPPSPPSNVRIIK
jgi:hypothetical protein